MTEHNHPGGAAAPIVIGGVPLHRLLANAVPELVKTVLDRLVDELPAYARLPHEQLRGDITRIIERGIRTFIEIVRTGEPAPSDMLATLREAIAQRAEEGVPIDAVLSAHHLGVRACWEQLGTWAEPEDLADALRLSQLQLRYLQDVTATVAAGYFQERQTRFTEEQAARHDLVSALLDGGPVTEAAARAGIGLPPSYFVVGMRIGEHPDERRSDVTASVAARRKLRRVRTELERAVGDPVLSTLTPDGGVALIPGASTAEDATESDSTWLNELISGATRAARCDLTVAVMVAGLSEVADAARTSRELLDVAIASGSPPGVYRMVDLALEFQLSRPGPAREKLAALLGPLGGEPHLLSTLHAYFRHGLSRRATGKHLHLHPNTVDYRLRKIAKLTGLDTTVATDLPRIRAALAAHAAAETHTG